jgi:hypothetical protein
MAKFFVSYFYYKLDDNGRPKSKTSTSKTIDATSDLMALQMIKSKHPGYEIELRKIEAK